MSNSKYTSPYAKKQLKKVKERNPEMYKKIMKREGLKENNTGGKMAKKPKGVGCAMRGYGGAMVKKGK